MDDFEEKLNSILSSPEAMGQIMALADSISGRSAAPEAAAAEGERQTDFTGENPLSFLTGLDPALMSKAAALLGEYTQSSDEKTALLNAMRPFLSQERQPKLDKAVQIARIARVIRKAMGEFGRDWFV